MCLLVCLGRPHIPHQGERRVPHSFAAFEICQGAATNLCAEKSMNSCTAKKKGGKFRERRYISRFSVKLNF